MTHLSLFSGIGGLDLAAEWAGFETVGQCEYADYPTKILEKHWPDVPRWRDIRTLTKENFYEKTGLRTVDVVSGGFPCQPFSVAGKQEGKEDDRYLWPEMRRVVAELEPSWVVGENVPGILRIAASDVVQDLESIGYDVVVFDFEAASVGAAHHRERIAFVANRRCSREQSSAKGRSEARDRACNSGKALAYADCGAMRNDGENEREADREKHAFDNAGHAGREVVSDAEGRWKQGEFGEWIEAWRSGSCRRWAAEPDVGRVAYGIPDRMDRLKCLGNAVSPQQFYPIFRAIATVIVEQSA